jgi:hypothetical protein
MAITEIRLFLKHLYFCESQPEKQRPRLNLPIIYQFIYYYLKQLCSKGQHLPIKEIIMKIRHGSFFFFLILGGLLFFSSFVIKGPF